MHRRLLGLLAGFVLLSSGLPTAAGPLPGADGPLSTAAGQVPDADGDPLPDADGDPLHGVDGALPGTDGSLPGTDGPVPGTDGPVPEVDGSVPGTDGPVLPEVDGPVPGTDGPVPGTDGPVPGTDGPVPGTDGPVPEVDGDRVATLLVGVTAGLAPHVHGLVGLGEVTHRIDELEVDVVEVPAGTVAAAVAAYRATPGVEYAEPNGVVYALAAPNDPSFGSQYALARIRAPDGWARYGNRWRATGGARIAVIDTGIDLLHPEFAAPGKISHCRSWIAGIGVGAPGCQEDNVHGTHVAGIAAAIANNRHGVAGVAFDAEVMALKALNAAGAGLMADIAAAIVYAADNGAAVANYSFGAATGAQTLRNAVAYADRRGVVQVASAGNDGRAGTVNYPAAYPEVMAVSSTDANDRLSSFSSYGAQIDVAAPGSSVLSSLPGGLYGRLSGTSMAAPHVAGLAALLRASGLSAPQARQVIRDGADDLGSPGRDARFGHGRVNAGGSLSLAARFRS